MNRCGNAGLAIAVGLNLLWGLASGAMAQVSSRHDVIAQFTLTVQPETAEDLMLDALEEQPRTAADFFLQRPDLTREQKVAIQHIYEQYAGPLKTAVSAYFDAVNVLNNLVDPAMSNEAISRMHDQVQAKETAVQELLFQRTIAIRAVLTEEQRGTTDRLLRSLLNLGTPTPAPTFPYDLLGQPMAEAIAQLESQGWVLAVRTRRTLMFNGADHYLDLDMGADGRVADVFVRDRARHSPAP